MVNEEQHPLFYHSSYGIICSGVNTHAHQFQWLFRETG